MLGKDSCGSAWIETQKVQRPRERSRDPQPPRPMSRDSPQHGRQCVTNRLMIAGALVAALGRGDHDAADRVGVYHASPDNPEPHARDNQEPHRTVVGRGRTKRSRCRWPGRSVGCCMSPARVRAPVTTAVPGRALLREWAASGRRRTRDGVSPSRRCPTLHGRLPFTRQREQERRARNWNTRARPPASAGRIGPVGRSSRGSRG